MKLGAKIFGILGGVLVLYLLVGLLMPGTWAANQKGVTVASPSTVFPFLNRMDMWQLWAPMPGSGSEFFGPSEGVGAGMRWDDPQYGSGEIQITGSVPNAEVVYSVEVENGALIVQGRFSLTPQASGTLLQWEESGDFGWNPLMGYAARGMGSSQAEAMRVSLERLVRLLEEGQAPGSEPDPPPEQATAAGG